jgi:hypothetical protein
MSLHRHHKSLAVVQHKILENSMHLEVPFFSWLWHRNSFEDPELVIWRWFEITCTIDIRGQGFMLGGWDSGSSLPLIFCIHVRSGPIYWGGYLPCKKDYKVMIFYVQKTWKYYMWWYFTCKHVSLFQNPLFYMYIFYKNYLQWIYWTLFFIASCSSIFVSELPEWWELRIQRQWFPLSLSMSMG